MPHMTNTFTESAVLDCVQYIVLPSYLLVYFTFISPAFHPRPVSFHHGNPTSSILIHHQVPDYHICYLPLIETILGGPQLT